MADQNRNDKKSSGSRDEDGGVLAARKARKYLLNQELLAKLKHKRIAERRRARRYLVNIELLEVNGKPGIGSRMLDLSMNGARLELPFSPPFMSQIVFSFPLPESTKTLRVVGRVLWAKAALERGRYQVGVQFYQNYCKIDQVLRLLSR